MDSKTFECRIPIQCIDVIECSRFITDAKRIFVSGNYTEARAESVRDQAAPADNLEATQHISVGPPFACPADNGSRRQGSQGQSQVYVAILKLPVVYTSAAVQRQLM